MWRRNAVTLVVFIKSEHKTKGTVFALFIIRHTQA